MNGYNDTSGRSINGHGAQGDRQGVVGVVGVVGAYGAVGTAACRRLAASGIAVRVGGRDPERTQRLARELGHGAHPMPVNLFSGPELDRFAAGCGVLLNCAGPASLVAGTVARAACRVGVNYVDAAGDDTLYQQVASLPWQSGRVAVLSAGMMPGLTGLLPRLLAAEVPEPRRLTGWVGGRDRFTVTAAHDYLASAFGFGEPLAAWRDGQRRPAAARVETDAAVPGFPGPAAVMPYLSTEAERLARDLGLREATWYSVFEGEHLWRVLSAPGDAAADPRERARRVVRAADVDLFGAAGYQMVVLEMAGTDTVRSLTLRGTGASELTGLTAALAAEAVRGGQVDPGTHHAADALDPAWLRRALDACLPEVALDLIDGPAPVGGLVEEGAL